MNQMSLFDFMPTMMVEPEVGEYVKECGAVIPRIMRKGYIGKKVLVDKSTESLTIFQVGILEDVIPYEGRERSIVYTGSRQRSLITHYPGREIRECLPWHAYERREDVIHHRENDTGVLPSGRADHHHLGGGVGSEGDYQVGTEGEETCTRKRLTA